MSLKTVFEKGLVLARYQMFSQVYFHKVRRIYDYHSREAIKAILTAKGYENGIYPAPVNINDYLELDDWAVYAALRDGLGGKHGEIWLKRSHYKCIESTKDIPTAEELANIKKLQEEHAETGYFLDEASAKWYSHDKDVSILLDNGNVQRLSKKSNIVKSMVDTKMQRFYVPRQN